MKFWLDPYNGKLAGVRVWKRALKDIEIYQAYYGVCPFKSNLLGQWYFEKGKLESDIPKNDKATPHGNVRLVRLRK